MQRRMVLTQHGVRAAGCRYLASGRKKRGDIAVNAIDSHVGFSVCVIEKERVCQEKTVHNVYGRRCLVFIFVFVKNADMAFPRVAVTFASVLFSSFFLLNYSHCRFLSLSTCVLHTGHSLLLRLHHITREHCLLTHRSP